MQQSQSLTLQAWKKYKAESGTNQLSVRINQMSTTVLLALIYFLRVKFSFGAAIYLQKISLSFFIFGTATTEKNHWARDAWPTNKKLEFGIKTIIHESLVSPEIIVFLPLHIKSGLMKLFVSVLSKEGVFFRYICTIF